MKNVLSVQQTHLVQKLATHRSHLLAALGLGCIVLLTCARLSSAPTLWWDEGWTMAVARNWIEHGHYGQFLSGQPAPLGLAAAFPIVAPVALSFRLFGVGIWQARLPFVLITLAAFVFIYLLANQLYSRHVATGAVAVLLLTSTNWWLNPILMGRQVLGEVPALLFLLIGYASILDVINGRRLYILPVAVFWGLALITKAQVLPFWTVSLLIPAVIVAIKRRGRIAVALLLGWLTSLIVSRLLLLGIDLLLRGHTLPNPPIPGLYQITALVTVGQVRGLAFVAAFILGLPTVLGLAYGLRRLTHDVRARNGADSGAAVVRLALLSLATSWLVWYLLLSIAWLRYLFPVTFVGSIFLSAYLHDLVASLRLSVSSRRGVALRLVRGVLVFGVIALAVQGNMRVLYGAYVRDAETSVLDAAAYLNTQTPDGSLIESYESELFPFLKRPYHFPPDTTQVPLTRRVFMGQDIPVGYDALQADPDYLVVKPGSHLYEVYKGVVESGAFILIKQIGPYGIYERSR